MKSIKQWLAAKLVKDERIDHETNKIKAEAFTIVMILAFIYLIAESLSMDLGIIKENNVFILFMVGCVYLSAKSTVKGLSNHSPIKGIKPIPFILLTCGAASILFGLFTAVKGSSRYLGGGISGLSVAVFIYSTSYMFMVTLAVCLFIYFISRKKEQKQVEE